MEISLLYTPTPERHIPLFLHNGFSIPLIVWKETRLIPGAKDYAEVMVKEEELKKKHAPSAIRRHLPSCCFNCHGATFATRRGWLNDPSPILNAESYKSLGSNEKVLPGDIAIYRSTEDSSSEIRHSASVIESNDTVEKIISTVASCTVVSKWGMWGEYIHNVFESPYGKHVSFYRFVRSHY